jgi:hypothetical protein
MSALGDASTARTLRTALWRPACLAGVGYAVILVLLLATHEWDPLLFATLGPQWARHDPTGIKKSDGIIYYAIASDPLGKGRERGTYRMEHILYPLLARAAALGRPALIPWTLVLINWASIVAGTELMHRLLSRARASPWWALVYGGWGGLAGALLKDTAEPLTYAVALLGLWWLVRGQRGLGAAACLAAILGRETAVLLVGPSLVLAGDRRRGRWWPAAVVALLWLGWILCVRYVLRAPAGARPRVAPLLGLMAMRPMDAPLTLVVLIVPAAVAIVLAVRGLCRDASDASLWALGLNAALALSLPAATAELFWHSGRVATGLVASTLLATSLENVAPSARRALLLLYASSVLWTLAVVARYVLFGVIVLPGG